MNTTTLNNTVLETIQIQFVPAAAFSVRVRMGMSARQSSRARIIQVSAAPCGDVPADGPPSAGRNALTKGQLGSNTMNRNRNSTDRGPYSALRLRSRETAVRVAGRRSGTPNVKRPQGCNLAGVDGNNANAQSSMTCVLRLPMRLLQTVALFVAVSLLAVKTMAQSDVGEIAPRTAPQGTEAALSVLQNARNVVQKRLANIASQADPLAEAVAAYRANPTPDTALALLKREAVVAGIGAKESEAIASEAATVANACAGLAAQTQAAAEMLRPGLDKAARARTEHATTREIGIRELQAVHRSLLANGITNETTMSAPERRKVATLLRLAGAADLSERFLKMEVGATEQVIGRLNKMSEQFAARQRNFMDLADAYKLHAASFKTVGGSVAQVARLIEVNQRFNAEQQASEDIEGDLVRMDAVLSKFGESLPDDITQGIVPTGTGSGGDSSSGSTDLWSRFMRFIGVADEPEPTVVRAETGGTKP